MPPIASPRAARMHGRPCGSRRSPAALLRLHVPGVLFEGWYDIRPRGDGALEVFGARARGLVFTRRG